MTLAASTQPYSLPHIAGYSIVEQLYLGSRTAVYRAVQTDSQRPVVIKVLRREYPSFSELVQFRNQYTIAKNLGIPGVVQPLSLEPLGSGYALVMEDFGGIALGQYTQWQYLSLPEILTIALQIADVLHNLSQHRIIHKDIKPANILIHPETKQIKLIDFSIASLLPKETQAIESPNILEGTLAYLAPEQTGRMNRGIDYRADFYALGVTLYQILTGVLPFTSDDPLELMHCHIAKTAVPANQVNGEVPPMVAAIVAKLMAKNAEDRYQSAIGLKYDLTQCLNQWTTVGAISQFKLGQQDYCDRFLIPEKLYGRETEVRTLLDAFDRVARGTTELMLVAGFSGIGKTAVVNEIHKPIVKQRGYFIQGKFDQFNRNIPLSAFVQAFRNLIKQLLGESDIALEHWKAKILEAVGENGQVIIEVIPELVHIIGEQPNVPELSGSAAHNRFNLLFGKFIRVVTTKQHPLVIFLDDLQWADSASLDLLKLLLNESEAGYLLVLGAYRDNEVFPAHPLMLALSDIAKLGAQLDTLTLASLGLLDITQIVADTLRCSPEIAAPLAELIYQKTQGNPFFTTQFLQGLHQDDCIVFDNATGTWQCDLAKVRKLALTDDVVEFMVERLRKLPAATQTVLKLAACIGNRFDLATLNVVGDRDRTEVATDLWRALQEGLVVPENETYKFFQVNDQKAESVENFAIGYHFLHDRVQQAAYALIPDEQKAQVHLEIGRCLVRQTTPEQQEKQIFTIVNHFNRATNLITDECEQSNLIRLNLQAAHKAHHANAYVAALTYATTSIQLLPKDGWKTQYDLVLSAYLEAAESAYLNSQFEDSIHYIEQVVAQATNLLDRIKAYEILVLVKIAQDRQLEAIQLGLDALSQLNVPLLSVELDHQAALEQLPRLESFPSITEMTDPGYHAALRILSTITPPVHHVKPELFPSVALTMLHLCLEHGHSPESAFIYAVYAVFCWAILNDFEAAYRACQIALKLLEHFPTNDVGSKVYMISGVFISACKDPSFASLRSLRQSIQIGQDVGDIEHISYSMMAEASFLPLLETHLDSVFDQQAQYLHWLQTAQQKHALDYSKIWHSLVIRLSNKGNLENHSSAALLDDADLLVHLQANHNHQSLFALHLAKTIQAYLFGEVDQAVVQAEAAANYANGAFGFLVLAAHNFYTSLALLAQCGTQSEQDKTQTLQRVEQNQQRMKYWADCAPCNFQHKYDLVEAEKYRICRDWAQAIVYYDRAIEAARDNGYHQESALASELATKFYLEWKKERIAQEYIIEAYYAYIRWGATAKVLDLEQQHPQLLAPILQQQQSPLTATETVFASNATTTFQVPGSHHSSSGNTGISSTLDLATVLKASQTLSSEIQLDKLLVTLLHTVLQNAGADKGALLMPRDQQWFVEAVARLDQPALMQSIAFEDSLEVPHHVINSVKRSLQSVVIVDAIVHPSLATDPYVIDQAPKSLLCTPILHQGKLVAMLYLENKVAVGAFTNDRVELLNFLCAQAAISLENARLYQQARTYVQQLEQSQLKIVQSEKMASLGNLVAGVAHEINNPIGFLTGSITNAKDYVKDLLEHLDLYQQHHSNPAAPVQAHADEIDLEFVSEDLPKLLESMKGATDRIKSISNSLRTFSRTDTEQKVSVNLHEGIESTLLILKYRIKANEHRPAIEIIREYGDLPEVECFPGQLNQVFMNILANAIDVFDEAAQSTTFTDLTNKPQVITIQTTVATTLADVEIRICDNGSGMPEHVRTRVFDHLFTTKGVGKGTGLGLAIARQIVVEKHGGSLEVQSSIGEGSEFLIRLPIQD